MAARLTDQAAVAVALARAAARPAEATLTHLLIGLATEPEGRAGRRLRERGSAAAALLERADLPGPPLAVVLAQAAHRAGARPATTVDLLDAAMTEGGEELQDLLAAAGYHRDLDGWMAGDPADTWFEDAETYGWQPGGEDGLDRSASRVVAQVRAVDGGAVEVLIAAAAAPDADLVAADPADLASVAARLAAGAPAHPERSWDAGLDTVVEAAKTLTDGEMVTVRDLLRAALVAGGKAPRLVVELVGRSS